MNIQSIAGLTLVVASVFVGFLFLKNRKGSPGSYTELKNKLTRRERLLLRELRSKYPPIPADDRLATFKKAGYFLEDITQGIALLFNELSIPSKEDKQKLKQGDLVQLNFVDPDNRVLKLWVEIIAIHKGLFQSELKTDTYRNANLKYGSNVWFHPNHVVQIK